MGLIGTTRMVNMEEVQEGLRESHEPKDELVGSARMLKKAPDESCPFYNPALPGCRIHSAKPQVCMAALYLSKMNLLICEEQKKVKSFPLCHADGKLKAKIGELASSIKDDPKAKMQLDQLFNHPRCEAKQFLLFLRLKGMEVYFGEEKAMQIARKLGLEKVPEDDALRETGLIYAVWQL